MMKRPLKPLSIRHRFARLSPKKRLGAIILLASGMMIMVFGFLAFTVDVGYISLTKAQLEAACDAGARAAVIELKDGLGTGKTKTPSRSPDRRVPGRRVCRGGEPRRRPGFDLCRPRSGHPLRSSGL